MAYPITNVITYRGRPVSTEDRYQLKKVGPSKVDLLFAGIVVRSDYTLIGSHSASQRLSYWANHNARTVTVMKPHGLRGGHKESEMALKSLTAATLAVISQTSLPALFGVVFIQSFTGGSDLGPLIESVERGYRYLAENIQRSIVDEFAKKACQDILEENIIAQMNVLKYARAENPAYLDDALVAADRTYAKIINLERPSKAKFQILFSSIQTIRYDVHLARAIANNPRELLNCLDVAEQSLAWLGQAKNWERQWLSEHLVGEVRQFVAEFIPVIKNGFSGNLIPLPSTWTRKDAEERIKQHRRELVDKICWDTDAKVDEMVSMWEKIREETRKKIDLLLK